MGYFINPRKLKNGSLGWGLAFRQEAGGVRTTKRIKPTDLRQYGLLPSMPIEEARARCKQLNAETKHFAKAERAKVSALTSANVTRASASRLFPPHLVDEFEKTRLKPKFFYGGAKPEEKYKKALSRWRFAIKMLGKLDLLPQEWSKEPRVFYKYFTDERISAGYAVKVLVITNMWGFFVSEKQGKPFLPVPPPRGYDRQVIEDAGDTKPGVKKESLPISPEMLEGVRAKLSPEYYNWIYLSVWFGLRPMEVGGQWKTSRKAGRTRTVDVLEVYQTKLTGVAPEKRWKLIPILFPEQEAALSILKSGQIKTPYQRLLHETFGRGYGLYGGRKGFVDLMLGRGQQLVNISRWLGHTSVDQTLRAYKNRDRVEFD